MNVILVVIDSLRYDALAANGRVPGCPAEKAGRPMRAPAGSP
jgi:hypothetical protein